LERLDVIGVDAFQLSKNFLNKFFNFFFNFFCFLDVLRKVFYFLGEVTYRPFLDLGSVYKDVKWAGLVVVIQDMIWYGMV